MNADAPMTRIRTTPDRITRLASNEVFVFGSNWQGRHGRGAAKDALAFGALYRRGAGHVGQTYAIPTKEFLDPHRAPVTMQLMDIRSAVERFLSYADRHRDLTFLVTPIGCGLAGLTPAQIAPLFAGAPPNVVMPASFLPYLS